MIGGSFFFSPTSPVGGFKGGLSLGKPDPTASFMIQYYTRIWDPKDGYFPDIKEGVYNLRCITEKLDDYIINLYHPRIPYSR